MRLRRPYQPITVDFYRKMPEGPPHYQLIEGNLILSFSYSIPHQRVLIRLLSKIANYLEESSLGELNVGPSEVYLDEINVFQPDLYFVRKENYEIIVKEGVKGAPDLVIEILEEHTTEYDRNEKRMIYARSGVKEMWIVNPDSSEIEVHLLERGLNAEPSITRTPDPFQPPIFSGMRIDTVWLFRAIFPDE